MFPNASKKLEDARTHIKSLRESRDAITFRSEFAACINALRSITYVLQKEGKKIPGFQEWYKAKQSEIRRDELLQFVNKTRISDFHKGDRPLRTSTRIYNFNSALAGNPPEPGASLVIGPEGPFWIVGKNTPHEQRIPVKAGGSWEIQIAIKDAPTAHLGKKLTQRDPITICGLAIIYFENLLFEAKSNLPPG